MIFINPAVSELINKIKINFRIFHTGNSCFKGYNIHKRLYTIFDGPKDSEMTSEYFFVWLFVYMFVQS